MSVETYGLMAEFAEAEALLGALRHVRAAGFTRYEAYAPFPVEGMDELLPGPSTPMAWIMGAAAAAGASGGYFMQWYATHDFPINVGGRPLTSWPAFIPITFELAVLTTAIVGVFAFLWIIGFPFLHHPAFGDPRFARVTQDRFFVCLRADDPHFSEDTALATLHATGPESIAEVLT